MGKKPAPSTADSLFRVESEAEWTDISISDTLPLPQILKNARFENPQFIAWSYHSQVYAVDVTIKGEQKRSILKLFPQILANRYTNEVNAYRLLDIASTGVVPKFYADLPSITKKMLEKILRDSVPADVEIALPALGILMEYLEGGQTPSKENMTAPIAKSILEGLDYIHGAPVLHGDCQPRNILIYPETGRTVWFDFSNSSITQLKGLFEHERRPVKTLLFLYFVVSHI